MLIRTNNKTNFECSNLQNIAIETSSSKIGFQFAVNLSIGDSLISFPHSNLKIIGFRHHERQVGLYQPFTTLGNYFVYGTSFNLNAASHSDQIMILAHSLPNIVNPQSKQTLTGWAVSASSWFNLNVQPSNDDAYTHPVVEHLGFLYGSHLK